MNKLKNDIINHIIDLEGGYVNDPSDSGGETNFGITYEVAKANGYKGDMIHMPRSVAFNIYVKRYWDSVSADKIAAMSEPLAKELVDTAVNMGVGRASEFLQRSLNVLNQTACIFDDIIVDRSIGPATVEALKLYLFNRDEDVLVKMMNCLQGAFYVELSERREKDEKFIYGWFKNRIEIP